MNCEQCVKECKAEGGKCLPLTGEQWARYGPGMLGYVAQHRRTGHSMHLTGGFYHCLNTGHPQVEAQGADAMRAAGMEPLL